MATYRVTIIGKDYEAIGDLIRKYEIDVFGPTIRQLDDGGYSVDAYINGKQIRVLKAKGYESERHEDADKRCASNVSASIACQPVRGNIPLRKERTNLFTF